MMPESKYAKEMSPPSYSHSFHAGNVGDVWKHTAIFSLVPVLQAEADSLHIVECHAGQGHYQFRGSGEWSEGIGRLDSVVTSDCPKFFSAYLKKERSFGIENSRWQSYAGSPLLFQELMRASDSLCCIDINDNAVKKLEELFSGDTRVSVSRADALDSLAGLNNESGSRMLIHLDPPWVSKQDWHSFPEAIVESARKLREAVFMLWYPIKSYTRVAAMQKCFEAAALPCSFLDLISTQLEHQRNRLNGSGLLLINAPLKVVTDLSGVAGIIGNACSTSNGYWQFRVTTTGVRE